MIRAFTIIAVFVFSIPSGALACLNGVLLRGDEAVRAATRLERLLRAGKYQAVIDEVDQYEEIEPASLEQHVELLRLTAVIRLESRRKPTRRSRINNIIFDLEAMQRRSPHDPLIQARLAEALALSPYSLDEGRRLLEDLAERDLMPDAEGWATLAYLRRAAQDSAGGANALARCRRIAKGRLHACAMPVS